MNWRKIKEKGRKIKEKGKKDTGPLNTIIVK